MEMEIVSKSLDGALLNEEEIAQLLTIPLFSRESAMLLSAAREKSERTGSGLAQVHAQGWSQCRSVSEQLYVLCVCGKEQGRHGTLRACG